LLPQELRELKWEFAPFCGLQGKKNISSYDIDHYSIDFIEGSVSFNSDRIKMGYLPALLLQTKEYEKYLGKTLGNVIQAEPDVWEAENGSFRIIYITGSSDRHYRYQKKLPFGESTGFYEYIPKIELPASLHTDKQVWMSADKKHFYLLESDSKTPYAVG